MKTAIIRSILGVFLALGLGIPVAVVHADDASEIAKLDRRLQEVEKSLANPLAGKKEYVDAAIALRSMLDQTNAMIEIDGDDDPESPLHKLHDRIITAQRGVLARLPSPRHDLFVRTGFPVPEYEEGKLLDDLAAELQAAQTALAGQLSASPDDAVRTRKLLHAMVLAQERLAWEAGWPFFPDEVKAFQQAGDQLTSDAYHARRQRGIDRINSRLEINARHAGRKSPREFVIHAPEDKAHAADVTKALARSRGKAADSWMKGARPFDAKERKTLLSPR